MATLKDIAMATGLSMNTVSRAIRGSGYVSSRTAELVRKTVKELDYHPNRAAQDLRRRRSRQITVVAESYDYLHIEKLAAIKEYAAKCGYTMGVHFTSEDYPQSTFSALLPDILEQNPAGLILIASSPFIIGKARELRKKLPCVMITFNGEPDIDCVYIDRTGGVYDAVHYLYKKGRRRIAFCETFRSKNRLLGYQRAVRELGLPELILSGRHLHPFLIPQLAEHIRRSYQHRQRCTAQEQLLRRTPYSRRIRGSRRPGPGRHFRARV